MTANKTQVSFRISDGVVRRLRNTVDHHRGAPLFLVLDLFVEEAITDAIHEIERDHNKGRQYDAPKGKKK